MPSDLPLERTPALSAMAGIAHGFTTRVGGVSVGAQASLNLALRADATREEVAENWSRAVAALAPGLGAERVALMTQVHGPEVAKVHAPTGPWATVGEADAAYTTEPGLVLAVRTADCVPVLLAAHDGTGAIAVAHAGWRGVVARVVPALVERLRADLGVDASRLVAAIGPAISGEAYEVGSEVVDGLRAAGILDSDFLGAPSARGRPRVDLRRAVAAQLRDAGVVTIETVARCTGQDAELYSHRVDGPATGRQAGLIVRWPS